MRDLHIEAVPLLVRTSTMARGAPTWRQRRGYHRSVNLLHRLAAKLNHGGRDRRRPELGLPCYACGQPATGWAISERVRDGTQVIEGYVACAAHQSGTGEVPQRKAG